MISKCTKTSLLLAGLEVNGSLLCQHRPANRLSLNHKADSRGCQSQDMSLFFGVLRCKFFGPQVS